MKQSLMIVMVTSLLFFLAYAADMSWGENSPHEVKALFVTAAWCGVIWMISVTWVLGLSIFGYKNGVSDADATHGDRLSDTDENSLESEKSEEG